MADLSPPPGTQEWVFVAFLTIIVGVVALLLERRRWWMAMLGLLLVTCAFITGDIRKRNYDTFPSCWRNFHAIDGAIQRYAESHNGALPKSWRELVIEGLDPAKLICPSSDDSPARGATPEAVAEDLARPGHCSYNYVGAGFTIDDQVVLVYESPENHRRVVGFLISGGRVEWLNRAVADKVIAELKAGQNPPPSLPPSRHATSAPAVTYSDSRSQRLARLQ
jgi:hypothetical protein